MKGKKYLEELLSNEFIIEEYKNEINKYVEGLEQNTKRFYQENRKQKDDWDRLKKYIQNEYKRLHGILETPTEYEMMALLKVFDKMREIEQGSDSND